MASNGNKIDNITENDFKVKDSEIYVTRLTWDSGQDKIQTERIIFKYANWPRLQIKITDPSSWSVY